MSPTPTPSQLEKGDLGEKLSIPSSSSADHLLRPPSPSCSSTSPPIVTRLGCWARASAVKRTAIVLTVMAIAGIALQQVSCRLHLRHICPRPPQIEFVLPPEDHFTFDAPSLYSPDSILEMSEADELESTWASHSPTAGEPTPTETAEGSWMTGEVELRGEEDRRREGYTRGKQRYGR